LEPVDDCTIPVLRLLLACGHGALWLPYAHFWSMASINCPITSGTL
jgi:hypothetical protein